MGFGWQELDKTLDLGYIRVAGLHRECKPAVLFDPPNFRPRTMTHSLIVLTQSCLSISGTGILCTSLYCSYDTGTCIGQGRQAWEHSPTVSHLRHHHAQGENGGRMKLIMSTSHMHTYMDHMHTNT